MKANVSHGSLERITSEEDRSSKCASEGKSAKTSSRVMNPTKPTSFRNKIQITKPEMERFFHCPQRLAAEMLGVSLSTLKRRFYNLGIGRWPYQLTRETNRKRSFAHLVNEEEPKSEKYLSPETVQTLTHLFSMSLQEQQRLATPNPLQRSHPVAGNESPNFKFLLYVPKSDVSPRKPKYFDSFISFATKEFKKGPEDSCNWTQ